MAGAEVREPEAVVDAVRATGLVGGGGPLLVLCSAGRDSACLLDVAVRLVGADAVHALHVNHGLRGGAEAAADADMVRGWCRAAAVALTVRAADIGGAPVGDRSGNVHAWARGERQRLADEVAAAVGARRVLVAHTRTDLVETALGRLATQPGRRALLSMRAVEGTLVRPLLAAGVSREETAAYCRERGLEFRDDPSNTDRSFARARVRHDVLPVLRSLNPRAEAAIARTLAELADEAAALDALVAAELGVGGAGVDVSACGAGMGGAEGGGPGPSIRVDRLAELPPALARLVLRELCERTTGAPCPRAASRLDDVLALGAAASRQGSGSVDVGDGARVELRRGIVRCVPSAGPAAPR